MADNIVFLEFKSENRRRYESPVFSLKDKVSLENRIQDWSATGLKEQKRMVEPGIKSRPVSTQRGTPTGWLKASLDQQNQANVFQGQISFQPPGNSVIPKRGLSGSQLQRNALLSRTGSQSSRRSDISHVTTNISVTPSARPPSMRLSARFSKGLILNDGRHVLNNYRWNSSDQGMRFQLQLSKLSTCRDIKKSSEAMSHQMDPMYCLFGSKLTLLNRYESDSDHTERKRSYDSRARSHTLQPLKPTSAVKNIPSSKWSDGIAPERGINSSIPITKRISTGHIKESGNVASETGSCETDSETEVTKPHPVTACSEMSQETESADFLQEADFGDLTPEIEHDAAGHNDVHTDCGEIRYSGLNQETESGEMNYSEVNQETESGEMNYSEVNQETESGEMNYSEVNLETESVEINYSEINQET